MNWVRCFYMFLCYCCLVILGINKWMWFCKHASLCGSLSHNTQDFSHILVDLWSTSWRCEHNWNECPNWNAAHFNTWEVWSKNHRYHDNSQSSALQSSCGSGCKLVLFKRETDDVLTLELWKKRFSTILVWSIYPRLSYRCNAVRYFNETVWFLNLVKRWTWLACVLWKNMWTNRHELLSNQGSGTINIFFGRNNSTFVLKTVTGITFYSHNCLLCIETNWTNSLYH